MNTKGKVLRAVVILAAITVVAVRLRPHPNERLELLERRIEALENQIAALPPVPPEPAPIDSPAVRDDANSAVQAVSGPEAPRGETLEPEVMARLQHVEAAVAETDRALTETIDERVTEAVDEEISRLEKKQNLKPSLADFADVLELDEDQVGVVEDMIWLGQDSVRAILEIPTADGKVLVDGLVEALAHREAMRPEAGPIFMAWLGEVMTTKIPGSEDTYALRVEAAKDDVRAALKQALTEEQYAEFERWKVDPTEVQEIEESPWNDLGPRIQQRAHELME